MNCSIVIELENLLITELGRTEKMLQQLAKQICENNDNFSSKIEVLIIYDEGETYDFDMEKIAKDNLKSCLALIDFKLLPAPPNTRYYEARNFGFKHTSNEIIIFLDR